MKTLDVENELLRYRTNRIIIQYFFHFFTLVIYVVETSALPIYTKTQEQNLRQIPNAKFLGDVSTSVSQSKTPENYLLYPATLQEQLCLGRKIFIFSFERQLG